MTSRYSNKKELTKILNFRKYPHNILNSCNIGETSIGKFQGSKQPRYSTYKDDEYGTIPCFALGTLIPPSLIFVFHYFFKF